MHLLMNIMTPYQNLIYFWRTSICVGKSSKTLNMNPGKKVLMQNIKLIRHFVWTKRKCWMKIKNLRDFARCFVVLSVLSSERNFLISSLNTKSQLTHPSTTASSVTSISTVYSKSRCKKTLSNCVSPQLQAQSRNS